MKRKQPPVHVTIPLPLMPPCKGDWDEYLFLVKQMKAGRVLLCAPMDSMIRRTQVHRGACALADAPDPAYFRAWSKELRARIPFFAKAGIETGFWLGHSIGHGGTLSGEATDLFQPVIGPGGKAASGCFCPADPRFRAYLAKVMGIIAESGVGLMLLDDDFRLNLHGADAQAGCFCPLHLELFAEKYGSSLSREELFRKAICGAPSRAREVWLETMASTLMALAGEISASVHGANPKVRLGLATAMTLWSSEGVDMRSLLSLLAGGTRPLIRLIGAPYWSRDPANIGWITEYGRLQKSWLKGFDAEIMVEGDTFPHTRYFCASETLTAFEAGMAVSGITRTLLYPVLYAQTPSREKGFTDGIVASRPAMAALAAFVPDDYVDLGVEPVYRPNGFSHTLMPDDPKAQSLYWPDEPAALRILGRLGIPMGYGGKGPVVFSGHGAAGLPDAEIRTLLARGALIDATAAKWLSSRGFDLGVESFAPGPQPAFERFLNGPYAGDEVLLLTDGEGLYWRMKLKKGAEILSEFVTGPGTETYPAAFLCGKKICVACFDFYAARNGRQLAYSYARQEQWAAVFARISGRPLPAIVPGEPDVRVVCRVAPDGKRVVVCLQNLRVDPLVDPVIRLDPAIEVVSAATMLLPGAVKPVHLKKMGKGPSLKVRAQVPAMGMLCLGLPQRNSFTSLLPPHPRP